MDLGDIWDKIVKELEYLISFEIEYSPAGTIYGIIMVILVHVFRKQVFTFIDLTMGIAGKLFWYPVFYIFAFIMGYLVGRKVWED